MRAAGHVVAIVGLLISLLGIIAFILTAGVDLILPALTEGAPLDIAQLNDQKYHLPVLVLLSVGGAIAMACGVAVTTHRETEEEDGETAIESVPFDSAPLRGMAHDRRSR